MKVYREFDQDTLDREYRIRDSVSPEKFEAAIASYGTESAAMRASVPCREDLRYGDSAEEVLDLFPAGDGAPLFVFIHGGYWRMLSHKESSFMARAFTARGVAVAVVNYALTPAVTLDEIVRQCRASIAWLYGASADFGYDRDRIFVSGSSAGGHLVGMLIAGGWHDEFGVPDNVIRGCCALSGLYDLEPLRLSEINGWVGLDAEAAHRNSPIHHLPARGCPLITAYGANETSEFKRQTDEFAAAWRGRGFAATHIDMPGTNHFDIVLDFMDPDGRLSRAVFDQMGVG